VIEHCDLSPELGPVGDQGSRGTCLAFAVTAAHEHARRIRCPRVDDLGQESLYWACKQIDGDRQAGTFPRSATEALASHGQSACALWPYDRLRDDTIAAYHPPAAAVAPDVLRRARMREIDTGLDALRRHLSARALVVLGLELWPQFFDNHGGVLAEPAIADLLGAGHAVAAVGFDDARAELLLRNSWGPGWGDDGHARLPYRAIPVVARGGRVLVDDIDAGS
jgi:hypothetical protein